MSDLTILCITKDGDYAAQFVEALEELAEHLDAECIVVSDGADVRSLGFVESVLDEALTLCHTDYVLRIDDDEVVTAGMRAWLASGAYREHDHWAFPRLNLWPDQRHYITNPPLYPDLQTRLSVKAKAGDRQTVHVGSPYGTGEVAPCALEHHKFLCRSMDERISLLDHYDSIQPGAGKQYAMFSVPELYAADLVTAKVPS